MPSDEVLINKFLNRKLDNWDWIKDVSYEELEEEILQYYPLYNPKIKPFKHQLVCVLLGILNDNFNFFLDMGLGKTFIILNLIQYYNKKALVLVPNEVNVLSWKNEIKKFTNFKSVGVSGSTKNKIELLNADGDVFICNYSGFLHIFKNGKKFNTDLIKSLLSRFDITVFDEIHKLGNSKSKISKLCSIIPSSKRYGLTGTPFGKSPEMLWSEFKIVDDGETLSDSENLFKSVFFTKSFNYFGGLDYHFKNKLSDDLNRIIKNKSITYNSKECIDLPELTKQITQIPFDKEGLKFYSQSYETLVNELKEGHTAIENSFVRLRAICSGYLYFRDENNKKVKSDFTSNPKLDYLIDLINDIDDKIIVFNEYHLSGGIIEDRLIKEKITYKRLYGLTKNKIEVIEEFRINKDIKVFILNSQSGGTGTNLQFCNHAIFYESPVCPIIRKQCEKRIYRIGQDKHTFIHDLVMKDSIENRILSYIEQGRNLYNSIIKDESNIMSEDNNG
jgi:SNF2 family DNA or RNA helicase